MKKIIFTLTLLSSYFLAIGQTFWTKVEDKQAFSLSHVTDKALFQDSIIVVSGVLNDIACYNYGLFAYGLSGENLWTIKGYYDRIKVDSNYIYTAGQNINDDDVLGDDELVLTKINKQGNKIFELSVKYNSLINHDVKDIQIAPDGTILVSTPEMMAKSNINGDFLRLYEVKLAQHIKGAIAPTSQTYLLYTQNRIYIADSSFHVSDSITSTSTIEKLLLFKDTIYYISNSNLIRIDTDLNIIDTLYTSSVKIENVEIYDNSIWLQFDKGDSIKIVSLNNSQYTMPNLLSNSRLIVAGNKYFFVGNSLTNQIGLFQIDMQSSTIQSITLPDLEMVDVDMDSIILDYQTIGNDTFIKGFYFTPIVTIKNSGSNTIKSFAIYADLHGGMNCANLYFYQKITSSSLSPGETITIRLKRSYDDFSSNKEYCFQCLAPNSELEIAISNNQVCKTFNQIQVKNQSISGFKVYPNPVSHHLSIEAPQNKHFSIEVIDANGKVLLKKEYNEQSVKINTNILKQGVYLLKIKCENKIYRQTFIKK
ncbi:MAG: T9SS type A sorting domain-containing protein [Bacteroidales bacterium]|nr:T9SS type A sorting domain-containing protein [Bacteroidales bacterium]